MERKTKIISVTLAIINLLIGLLFVFVETENNLYWSGAFTLNGALILVNIKTILPITPMFMLSVYYMYWAMIHIKTGPNLTEEGKRIELLVGAFAFFAFLSIGWLYYINRKRW